MNFNWSKAIGFGVLIWAIMFVVGTLLVALGITLSIGWMFGLAIIAAIISYSFALNANPQTSGSALGYGLTWAVIGVILDAAITQQFAQTAGIFNIWPYWVGYALILLAPWAEMGMSTSDTGRHVTT